MLIEFAISNFRSIKERQVISMLPSERVKSEIRKNALLNAPQYKDLNLLVLAAIYGGNGAGKSNIIKAFRAMEWLVLNTHTLTHGDILHANECFVFDTHTHNKPTIFEITFIAADKKQYLYKIEFDKNAVLKEELYYFVISQTGKTTKRKLFVRNTEESISFGDDFKGNKKINVLDNILFLSKSIHENDKFLIPIFDFFKKGFQISDFSNQQIDFQTRYFGATVMAKNTNDLLILNDALQSIDSGILSIDVQKVAHLPKNVRVEEKENANDEDNENREKLLNILKTEIRTTHRLFENEREIGVHSLELRQESDGTQKFIAIFTALQNLFKKGSLMIIDEIDRSLHPFLTNALLKMVADPQNNPNGAQLIFTTHTPSILDSLDYDQVNLTQKDRFGATELYAVSDIRGLRPETLLSRSYLRGDLEGVPTISTLHSSQMSTL